MKHSSAHATHPYQNRPVRAFWKTAVAGRSGGELVDLWQPKSELKSTTRIATFGSCFARNIGARLVARNWGWINAEPAPDFAPEMIADAFGYGHFSARTGNIYTTAALLQWLGWAAGQSAPVDEVWPYNNRWIDPFRGEIEPNGFESPAILLQSRAVTIAALRKAIESADVFLFTLGLTEYWSNAETGAVYQTCPGTRGGRFDATRHQFNQARTANVLAELDAARDLLHHINPALKLILTVSPVSPSATMTEAHILTAASHSKSVLRAAAGDCAATHVDVDYFPGYELITGALAGEPRYAVGQRHVAPAAIDMVMDHFFAAASDDAPKEPAAKSAQITEDDECDEAYYAAFAPDAP